MTGGYQNSGLGYYLDSTELLTVGDTAWRTADPLPAKINGLKAITIDNVPFVLGVVSSILGLRSSYLHSQAEELQREQAIF